MQETEQKYSINFIGAGKLGKTIARLIVVNQAGSIQGVCNSSWESSRQAIDFIGEGQAFDEMDDLPSAQITFITVPDDKIKNCCDKFSRSKNFNPHGIVVHCSGLLTSDVLNAAKLKGCAIASIHPMRSFAEPSISVKQFTGTFCAIESSLEAETFITDIFKAIGGKVIPIDKNKKSNYHSAGVIASNYLITLAYNAVESLKDAGIHHNDAMDITINLMNGTLHNLSSTKSAQESLTGPISRGDVETIKKHMAAFKNAQIKKLYAVLGESTLELTSHDKPKKQAIQNALQER